MEIMEIKYYLIALPAIPLISKKYAASNIYILSPFHRRLNTKLFSSSGSQSIRLSTNPLLYKYYKCESVIVCYACIFYRFAIIVWHVLLWQ